MAEILTVTPFPKDLTAVIEYLLERVKYETTTMAIRRCGVLYVIDNHSRRNEYPMNLLPVNEMKMDMICQMVESPYTAIVLLKYEDDEVAKP